MFGLWEEYLHFAVVDLAHGTNVVWVIRVINQRVKRNPLEPAISFEKMYSYLVDSASSHMLVSKIKPCMSKFKRK